MPIQPELMRIIFRGFGSGELLFEEHFEVDIAKVGIDGLDAALLAMAGKHLELLRTHDQHMIEIEFLDEPDPERRFYRIGTDPSRMVMPVEVELADPA